MSAGDFATARRGGLTMVEIREIEAHRCRERPTPWQALSARYGRPVAEIQALMAPAPQPEPVRQPAPTTPVWDGRRIKRLKTLFIDLDLPASEVAVALGCSREAVIGKARRLGLNKAGQRAAA